MANFTFNCPQCNQPLEAQDEWRGQQTQCPSCGTNIEIPKIMLVKPVNIDPGERLKKLKNAVVFFIICTLVCFLCLVGSVYNMAIGSDFQKAFSHVLIPLFVIVIFLCILMSIAVHKKIRELKSQIDQNEHLK